MRDISLVRFKKKTAINRREWQRCPLMDTNMFQSLSFHIELTLGEKILIFVFFANIQLSLNGGVFFFKFYVYISDVAEKILHHLILYLDDPTLQVPS